MRFLALLLLVLPVAAQTPHQVALTWTWTSTAGPATGFHVQRGTVSGGPYATIATFASTAILTFTDVSSPTNTLTEGVTYFWVVTAFGPGGDSLPSPEFSGVIPITLPDVPSRPTSLTGTIK